MRALRHLTYEFLTAVSLLLILNANLMAVPNIGLDRRTRGVDKPVLVSPIKALEIAVSPQAVAVIHRSSGGESNDLVVYRGTDYQQAVPVLLDTIVFGLSAYIYLLAGYLVFTLIHGNQLYLGMVDNSSEPSPQGGVPVFLSPVSFEEGFFSSDVYVSESGEILVLGYFADGATYQPRLYYSQGIGPSPQGAAPFVEIPLGLQGNYSGAIYGSPHMRLMPELPPVALPGPAGINSGRKIYLWATKVFSQEQNQLVLIEVDLDAALSAPAGQDPSIVTGFGFEYVIALLAAASGYNDYVDTAVAVLGTAANPILAFLFMDDHWRLKAALFDLRTGEFAVAVIDALSFKQEGFVTLSAACGLVGDKYRCSINAGPRIYIAFGGRNPELTAYWLPRFKEARLRVRSDDNLGVLLNYCFARFTTYGSWQRFFANVRPRQSAATAPAGAQENPFFGFRTLYIGQSVDVPQIVQGEGLTQITVSNTSNTTQEFEYLLSAPDGTLFQNGTEMLVPNQTATIQVEGTAPDAGAATILSPLGVTVQSLTDLSSLVDTPVFGAPGVEASDGWSLPFVTPNAAEPGGASPSGTSVPRETGIAIHNIDNVTNLCTFTAYDDSGVLDTSEEVEYGPFQQDARFMSQIFPNLTSTSGLVTVDCDEPVAVVGAIQEQTGAVVLTPANPD